jgi:hypothetical protein
MHCEHCGKELQENETCACRSFEEKAQRSSFPLWLIPGVICAVITLGYVVLKLFGYNYFVWVNIVWLFSAIAFFYLLMPEIKHYKHTFKLIGKIILTVLFLATAGRALFNTRGTIYDNKHVFVSDIVDKYSLIEPSYGLELAYEYRNFIWYGPLLGRLRDYPGYFFDEGY